MNVKARIGPKCRRTLTTTVVTLRTLLAHNTMKRGRWMWRTRATATRKWMSRDRIVRHCSKRPNNRHKLNKWPPPERLSLRKPRKENSLLVPMRFKTQIISCQNRSILITEILWSSRKHRVPASRNQKPLKSRLLFRTKLISPLLSLAPCYLGPLVDSASTRILFNQCELSVLNRVNQCSNVILCRRENKCLCSKRARSNWASQTRPYLKRAQKAHNLMIGICNLRFRYFKSPSNTTPGASAKKFLKRHHLFWGETKLNCKLKLKMKKCPPTTKKTALSTAPAP